MELLLIKKKRREKIFCSILSLKGFFGKSSRKFYYKQHGHSVVAENCFQGEKTVYSIQKKLNKKN